MYRISIITVNYNDVEGLRKTLASVASQTYQEIEHIIIDGASTDGSVELIRDYAESSITTRHVLWISEPDDGIYDAMNKGVANSTGDYLLFLNGGDALVSKTALADAYPHLINDDFIIGRTSFSYKGTQRGTSPLLTEDDLSMYHMYLKGINHQSAFIKRSLLVKNPYDITVKINADWLFFVQEIIINNATVKFVDLFFVDFDCSGLSSNTAAVIKEREDVIKKLLPPRMARNYIRILPHYYEVVRVQWLLKHPICYKIYRGFTTLSRKILGE